VSDKIKPTHLERRALVYLRQSMPAQVRDNPESTARQYALRDRALLLGWPPDRIEVVDEDLGQSGSSTERRGGFQRLAEDVAHGRVGGIFALEVSRLARSSADWYRLLDLCGLADVVLADEQAVYAPGDDNDRLLLGLKGTMSEAELTWMRLRLWGARVTKARRGELRLAPPIGYEWDDAARRYRLDPDETIQRAVRLIFDRFRLEGTLSAVARYFARQGLDMPSHDMRTHERRWRKPSVALVASVLHNPVYAGAYVFGRSKAHRVLRDGKAYLQHDHPPQNAWVACLRDRHPAYITWDEYLANQQKLRDNYNRAESPDAHGAPRDGSALLQGLVLCGKCGRRMNVSYPGARRIAHYWCWDSSQVTCGPKVCFQVAACSVDEAVVRLLLETVQPPEIELSLAVLREAERQVNEVDHEWQLRLDRARYEAGLAERRYKAVDPDNRVVARTLEHEWNERLAEVESLDRRQREVRRREVLDLTDQDRERIRALSQNLPRVWHADTTTNAERKNLLRMLIREVSVGACGAEPPRTRVRVLWQTGATTELTVPRPAYAASSEEVALIRQRASDGQPDPAIATELNDRGSRTGAHRAWTAESVRSVRRYRHLTARSVGAQRVPDRRSDGLYSVHGVAARLGVTECVVRYWVRTGRLKRVAAASRGRARWYDLSPGTIKRLQRAMARRRGFDAGHIHQTKGKGGAS
jgi:DNA invertase Pin-like site-specific DNA recombinase